MPTRLGRTKRCEESEDENSEAGKGDRPKVCPLASTTRWSI